ncbi:MAG: peptidyl-prolyl cis-trans isomerase [Comamonadaceae bacterium]|nr:MAG: peptidyl-prolyl cis-trans isomerase [Comamonadaceae bacterium]
MFDFFRKYNKIVLGLLFLLIIPSFVLFGVERYTNGGANGETVATVDGTPITRPEWDLRHRQESDRIRQQMPNVDPSLLDSEAARYATLERIVRDRVLAAAAARSNMSVSEERLTRLFAEDAGLASFRTADGKFDRERFLRTTGQTPEQYEASVREQLATQQVLLGMASTAFATKAQADATLGAFYDRREVQVARFNPADYVAKVQVSESDVEAYYKSHGSEFQAPEQAAIEYVVLDLDAAKKNISVSEADLKSYYDQNTARFGSKEERRASHILIAAPASASASEKAAARSKAEALLAEARKSPGSFADLAKKNSQDPGSAERGGDLDFVSRGAMVKPFDDAMFALKKGEISGLVESEFGFHIILLTDIKAADVTPFDRVREDILNEVRNQQATQEFAKAAESFTELVYQQPDSLKPVAERLKLEIRKADRVARTAAPGTTGALGSRAFLSALFTPDVLERKHNTEAIEIAPNQLASGRIVSYSAARALRLDEVKDRVRTRLLEERAAALARTEGAAKLKAAESDPDAVSFGAAQVVSRLEPQSLSPVLIESALRADASKLPKVMGVDQGAEGFALLRINKTVPRSAVPADAAAQELEQFAQAVASAENAAYYAMLMQRNKVKILVSKPAAGAANGSNR